MNSNVKHLTDEVVLYRSPKGDIRLDVKIENESVWLSLNQIAELFGRDKSVIAKHLANIFKSGELSRRATVAKNATVRYEGKREVVRNLESFNLDAILSVGYRVNSKRGTQFRIWATRTLKDHLLRGYTLNEQRLREKGFGEIEQAVALMGKTLRHNSLVTEEGRAVLDVVQSYTNAWRLLLAYDEDQLSETPAQPRKPSAELSLEQARAVIEQLRGLLASRQQATALFGRERNEQLVGVCRAINLLLMAVPAKAGYSLGERLIGLRDSPAHCRRISPRPRLGTQFNTSTIQPIFSYGSD